nr:serine/arginine repetitive matrix protein 1-like [Marmota flaviventris]
MAAPRGPPEAALGATARPPGRRAPLPPAATTMGQPGSPAPAASARRAPPPPATPGRRPRPRAASQPGLPEQRRPDLPSRATPRTGAARGPSREMGCFPFLQSTPPPASPRPAPRPQPGEKIRSPRPGRANSLQVRAASAPGRGLRAPTRRSSGDTSQVRLRAARALRTPRRLRGTARVRTHEAGEPLGRRAARMRAVRPAPPPPPRRERAPAGLPRRPLPPPALPRATALRPHLSKCACVPPAGPSLPLGPCPRPASAAGSGALPPPRRVSADRLPRPYPHLQPAAAPAPRPPAGSERPGLGAAGSQGASRRALAGTGEMRRTGGAR